MFPQRMAAGQRLESQRNAGTCPTFASLHTHGHGRACLWGRRPWHMRRPLARLPLHFAHSRAMRRRGGPHSPKRRAEGSDCAAAHKNWATARRHRDGHHRRSASRTLCGSGSKRHATNSAADTLHDGTVPTMFRRIPRTTEVNACRVQTIQHPQGRCDSRLQKHWRRVTYAL